MGFQEQGVVKNIDKHENEISELKETIKLIEQKRTENEQLTSNLRQHKASLEGEIIVIEKSLHLEKSDLEASEEKKSSLLKHEEDIDKKKLTIIQGAIINADEIKAGQKERVSIRTKTSLFGVQLVKNGRNETTDSGHQVA